jgi:hypothetical protein
MGAWYTVHLICSHTMTCIVLSSTQAEAAADEEVGAAQLRIAEAQAAAAAAATERSTAEAAAASARQQAAAARAEAGRLGRELAAVQQAAEATALDARQQLAAKDRCGVVCAFVGVGSRGDFAGGGGRWWRGLLWCGQRGSGWWGQFVLGCWTVCCCTGLTLLVYRCDHASSACACLPPQVLALAFLMISASATAASIS